MFRKFFFVFAFLALSNSASAISIFTVSGEVKNPDGSPAADGLTVSVRNKNRMLTENGNLRNSGMFMVAFVKQDGFVAMTGETLEISVIDPVGEVLVKIDHKISSQEMVAKNVTVNLQISSSSAKLSTTRSTVVVTPTETVANGVDLVQLHITLIDTQSNPIAGQVFDFRLSGLDNTVTGRAPTDMSGQSVIKISSTHAAIKTATVSLGNISLDPIKVKFVADSTDANLSTVTSPNKVFIADNSDYATMEITLVDQFRNPVVGKFVKIESDDPSDTITVSGLTDPRGEISATIKTTKSGLKTLTIRETSENVELFTKPKISFKAGELSSLKSSVTATSPIIADGEATSTVTVTLVDRYENPVVGEKAFIFVSGFENDPASPIATTLSDENGKATATFSSTKSEVKTITAEVNGELLNSTAQTEFMAEFNHSATIIVDQESLPADGTSQANVIVTILDQWGKPATTQTPIVVTTQGTVSTPELRVPENVWVTKYTAGTVAEPVVLSVLFDNLILASRSITLTDPNQTVIKIESTSVSPKIASTNDTILFQMVGTADNSATLSVSGFGAVSDLPMIEDNPGIYTAIYTVRSSDKVSDGEVIFKLNSEVDRKHKISVNSTGIPIAIEFLSGRTVQLGTTQNVQGQIDPVVAGLKLEVTGYLPDGTILSPIEVSTDRQGQFSFQLEFDRTGGWIVEVNHGGNKSYLPANGTTIFVVTPEVGKAIIVLGGGDRNENPAWERFNALAESMHDILTSRKFDRNDDIKFLSPEPVKTKFADTLTSAENLRSTIVDWASPQLPEGSSLLFYFIAPNLDASFPLGDSEFLTPNILDGWLDQLPETTKVTIFIESSFSGSFISSFSGGSPILSTTNRTIITSTGADRQTRILPDLSSFTTSFFREILENRTIAEAFTAAHSELSKSPIHWRQSPQIDSNGNGIPNDPSDLSFVSDRYIPVSVRAISTPRLEIVTPAQILSADVKSIELQVEPPKDGVMEMFGTVIPPSFDANSALENWSELDFEHFELSINDDGIYSGIYNLSEPGKYNFLAHGRSNSGKIIYASSSIEVELKPPFSGNKPTLFFDLCKAGDGSCELPTIRVGTIFELWLQIEGVENLIGFDATIKFDPQELSAISFTEGDFLSLDDVTTFNPDAELDPVAGKAKIAVSRLSKVDVSGSGNLAKIEFRTRKAGSFSIGLEAVNLSDLEAKEIPSNLVDFTVDVGNAFPAWDLNEDGTVNIFDLVLVGGEFGAEGDDLQADLNDDGIVNIFDIVLVGIHFGETYENYSLSPSKVIPIDENILPILEQLKLEFEKLSDASPEELETLRLIERLITSASFSSLRIPARSRLYQNYPNPFNPETWLPFELSENSEVKMEIFDVDGNLVRRLNLGTREAGSYVDRDGAAYWDGFDFRGEAVSSGIYFYSMRANNFSSTRKMLIVK